MSPVTAKEVPEILVPTITVPPDPDRITLYVSVPVPDGATQLTVNPDVVKVLKVKAVGAKGRVYTDETETAFPGTVPFFDLI